MTHTQFWSEGEAPSPHRHECHFELGLLMIDLRSFFITMIKEHGSIGESEVN